ncbi:MAG: hypothetical protein CMJ88_03595 [Planctomycetes bacterium]|nr:hypothetical protein [Planctomycetota bacterium]
MTKKTTLIAVLALCGALSQSCQMSPNEPPGVDSKQFQDYVVPSGFRLKDRKHESYAREVASWRHGHYVYSGSSKVAAAASYVEANMGRHSWRLVTNEEVDEKSKRLQFERGIYTTDYLIQRDGNVTRITVDYKTDYTRL